MGDQMITGAQVPSSPTDTLIFNAQEAGGPSIPGPMNNPRPLSPSFFELGLFMSLAPFSTPLYCQLLLKQTFTPNSDGESYRY